MGRTKLVLAARKSPLARLQVDEALGHIPDDRMPYEVEVQYLDTPGDRDRSTPLDSPDIPDDFFTRDLDQALLNGDADLTIHSAKDLPDHLHPDLQAIRLPARDIRDALVCREGFVPDRDCAFTIGSSSERRAAQISALYPLAELRPLRGNIHERIAQVDDGAVDAAVIAGCALLRLGLDPRITQWISADPAPQQGRLAFVFRRADQELAALLESLDVIRNAGLVALVGCPADSSYLSRKAEIYLKAADVILHDRLISDEILLRIHDKGIPVGKSGKEKSMSQADIHRLMLQYAERGNLVVRLHGGDPCIYGHLAEELEFLRDWNLRYDVLPAVTAAQVASAHARSPLTHRGDTGDITFLPGYKATGEAMHYPGPERGNLAVYMGVSSAAEVQEGLRRAGWPDDTPVVAGERLGYRDERHRHLRLDQLKQESFDRPSVFLIGTRSFPSSGWTLFVGTDPSGFLAHGPILHWPLIQLQSTPIEDRIAQIQEHLKGADGILFPSRFAVDSFMEALLAVSDTRALHHQRILSVGPATTEKLKEVGLRADASVDHYGGIETLKQELPTSIQGRILYPCSDAAPVEQRKATLADQGVELVPLPFYRNRKITYSAFPRLPIHRVLFTSGSSVQYYFDLYPEERGQHRIWLAVGPSTRKAIEAHGLTAHEIPAPKMRITPPENIPSPPGVQP